MHVLEDEENFRTQPDIKKARWMAVIPTPGRVLDVSKPQDQKQDSTSWALFLGFSLVKSVRLYPIFIFQKFNNGASKKTRDLSVPSAQR